MKARWYVLCGLAVIICGLSACGNAAGQDPSDQSENVSMAASEDEKADIEPEDLAETEVSEPEVEEPDTADAEKVLVAYFTRLPNTESGEDLDAVVQGGGPYGAIGESFASADLDAISSASITVTDEGVKGNVEAVAEWIAAYTGGDLFSIETVEKYPLDYSTLIDQGGEEQQASFRPELSTHVENMEEYSVIYLGYPNWYYDMPMALYSFLEEYSLDGKTIVPFTTSAGSGLSDTVSQIAKLQPGAEVIEDALAIPMRDVKNSEKTVTDWVDRLGIEP